MCTELRPRPGLSLIELTVALWLASLITAIVVSLLLTESRIAGHTADRAEVLEATRTGAAVLHADLAALDPLSDVHLAEPESLTLRVFRGVGVVCGFAGPDPLVRYRGVRQPDPQKDSVIVLTASPRPRAEILSFASPAVAGCAVSAGEELFLIRLATVPSASDLLAFYEVGSYHLERALRYRRGAGGRQPITAEVFADSSRVAAFSGTTALTVELFPEASSSYLRGVSKGMPARIRVPVRNRRARGTTRTIVAWRRSGGTNRVTSRERLRPPRHGSALVIALLGVLLLELAVAGVLYIATQEMLIARAYAQRLRARSAAESGVHTALARWPADSLRVLPSGGVQRVALANAYLPSGASFTAEIERLHGRWFLVRGEGRTAVGGPPAAHAVALVSMIETGPLWRAFPAAVTAAGDVDIGPSAHIDALQVDAVPPWWSAATCPAASAADAVAGLGSLHRPALATSPGSTISVDPAAMLAGAPLTYRDSALVPGSERIGPFDLDSLASIADRIETGTVHLAPAWSGATCDSGVAGNWGDPSSAASPCADYMPLVYAPGDLEVSSGAGQGLLVVRGRLRLATGAHFVGAILAEGGADVQGTILGALRTGTGASGIDGELSYNACALWRAFTLAGPFRRPYRRGNRWWLPAF